MTYAPSRGPTYASHAGNLTLTTITKNTVNPDANYVRATIPLGISSAATGTKCPTSSQREKWDSVEKPRKQGGKQMPLPHPHEFPALQEEGSGPRKTNECGRSRSRAQTHGRGQSKSRERISWTSITRKHNRADRSATPAPRGHKVQEHEREQQGANEDIVHTLREENRQLELIVQELSKRVQLLEQAQPTIHDSTKDTRTMHIRSQNPAVGPNKTPENAATPAGPSSPQKETGNRTPARRL